jgi:hypothetical protein
MFFVGFLSASLLSLGFQAFWTFTRLESITYLVLCLAFPQLTCIGTFVIAESPVCPFSHFSRLIG